jgi:hypothetical protein
LLAGFSPFCHVLLYGRGPSILYYFLVVWQLNNLELVVNFVKRGNLPGVENLENTFFSCFHLLTLLSVGINCTFCLLI